MKKSYLAIALMFMCLLGVGVSARAQDTNAVVVSVPFEFVAGGATLPAGEYRVSLVDPDSNREIVISGYGKGSAFLLPLAFEDGPANQPSFSFEHVGGKYFLSSIKTPNGAYVIATPREMIMLGQRNTPSQSTSSASGSH
jgi:hypothetical protein